MKQLSTDEAIKLIVALLVAFALIAGMTSCSSSRVYEKGNGWHSAPKKSDLTGWAYQNK